MNPTKVGIIGCGNISGIYFQAGKTFDILDIVGCADLHIDYAKKTVSVGQHVLKDGDFISIDGFTGEVMAGQVATQPSEVVQVLIDKTLKEKDVEKAPKAIEFVPEV